MKAKSIFTFIWAIFPLICFSQVKQFHYPEIEKTGINMQHFVPSEWTIIDSACDTSSLNKRTAFVIQSSGTLNMDARDAGSGFAPKMLVVLLKQPDDLWKLSSVGIKIFDTTGMGINLSSNTYQGIQFMHDTLSITFGTGGTVNDYTTYYFRYQNNDWYLVGLYDEEDDMQESEGVYMTSNRTINFIKGEVEISTYDPDTKRYKKDKKQITLKPLVKLEDFDNRSGE